MQLRTQRGNLLTLCERKTRFAFTAPLPSKQAVTTDDALRKILGPLLEPARRSVTFDNGSEFASSEPQRRAGDANLLLRPPFPFWQRGTIENTNGDPCISASSINTSEENWIRRRGFILHNPTYELIALSCKPVYKAVESAPFLGLIVCIGVAVKMYIDRKTAMGQR